jgi:hypothetical protein
MRHWLQDKAPALCCDGLRCWPPLKAAQLARRSTRDTVCRAPHGRYAAGMAPRSAAITAAILLPTAAGVIAPHALLGQALVAQLRVSWQASAHFAPASAQRAQRHPDCPCFQALPGAGPGCALPAATNGNALLPLPHSTNMPASRR